MQPLIGGYHACSRTDALRTLLRDAERLAGKRCARADWVVADASDILSCWRQRFLSLRLGDQGLAIKA